MKLNKKKVFVAALAVCLVAILSMGTLAWFNAADEVTNDFHVAVDGNDTNPEFSVDVTETTGEDYWKVLPGSVIDKDPAVTNTGDYDQWIRVAVTMTKAKDWQNFAGPLTFTSIFKGYDYGLAQDVATSTAPWLLVKNVVTPDATTGEATWYLYLNEKLNPNETEKVFTSVKIDEDFTMDEVQYMAGEFSIIVRAEALQADNTGDNAVEAFANVGWAAGTNFVNKND